MGVETALDDTFIEHKTGNCRYWFTFIYNSINYGVWVDSYEGKMYVSLDIDPTYPLIYAVTTKDHKPNTLFIKDRARAVRFRQFIECYKMGNVRFESITIKNVCYEVIKMSLSL